MKRFSIFLTIVTYFSFSNCVDKPMSGGDVLANTIRVGVMVGIAGAITHSLYEVFKLFYDNPDGVKAPTIREIIINDEDKKTKTLSYFFKNNATDIIIDQPNPSQTDTPHFSNENKNDSLNTTLSAHQDNTTDTIVDQPHIPQTEASQSPEKNTSKEKPKKHGLFKHILRSIEEMHLDY